MKDKKQIREGQWGHRKVEDGVALFHHRIEALLPWDEAISKTCRGMIPGITREMEGDNGLRRDWAPMPACPLHTSISVHTPNVQRQCRTTCQDRAIREGMMRSNNGLKLAQLQDTVGVLRHRLMFLLALQQLAEPGLIHRTNASSRDRPCHKCRQHTRSSNTQVMPRISILRIWTTSTMTTMQTTDRVKLR